MGNCGPAESFMQLLYSASPNYDYYAFADQDDIWEPDKLKSAIIELERENAKIPLLYCSNQTLYRNGREERMRFNKKPNYTLVNTLCGNSISGCTMVMNKELHSILCEKLHRPSNEMLQIRMHDVWVLLAAEVCGKVIYDSRSFIKYRLHEHNTVGINSKNIRNRYHRLVKLLKNAEMRNGRKKTAAELLYRFNMEDENRQILELFSNYSKGFRNKIALLRNKDIKRDCEENRLVFITKVLLNWI